MKYILIILFASIYSINYGQIYTTIDGDVQFISDAPLEVIQASSDQMQGVLDIEQKAFAFKMYIKSFEGFNNPLQQVHFYENYMEANEFPIATFKGKILESITPEKRNYRAKGIMEIHGKSVERIIEVNLTITDNLIIYNSKFTVPLADHNIKLPRIVYQKIAEEIIVSISGEMKVKQ